MSTGAGERSGNVATTTLTEHYSSQENICYNVNVEATNDSQAAHKALSWLPILVLPLTVLACRDLLPPWVFMWMLSFAIYLSLKWLTWWRARSRIVHPSWRSAAYLLAWPGMDAEAFLNAKERAATPTPSAWLSAMFKTVLGAILLWVVARSVPQGQPLLRGWLGMVGLILLLHFGTFQIVALVWQKAGVAAEPIMSAPLRSTCLAEFWGKRWNLGFRQLAHELVFRPLYRRWGADAAGFVVFVVSGLIHDLVISVPARGGYGFPTLYFLLQGAGVAVERSQFGKRFGLGRGVRGWCFMVIFLTVPVFGLFHPPFVLRVILPFMRVVHAI
jgi:Membrane bound O-acyl transferase family